MKVKTIKKLIILIFILLTITVFVYFKYKNGKAIDIKSLVNYINSYGQYALICFLIIFTLKPLMIFIPSAMMSIVGGILFGPVKGFIFNMLGFFLSGTLAFFLSKFLGKDFVDSILKGKTLKLNSNLEKKGFTILFLLRFPPVIPYDPLSYACGLTKIRYSSFILASVLGVIPETLCYSIMGRNICNPFSYKFIIPIIVLALGTLVASYLFKKSKTIN